MLNSVESSFDTFSIDYIGFYQTESALCCCFCDAGVKLNFSAALEWRINRADILNLRYLFILLVSSVDFDSSSFRAAAPTTLSWESLIFQGKLLVLSSLSQLISLLARFCRILSCTHNRSMCLQACDSLCRRRCVFPGFPFKKFLQSHRAVLKDTGCKLRLEGCVEAKKTE